MTMHWLIWIMAHGNCLLVGKEDIQLAISIAPVDVQIYADTKISLGLDKTQTWLADFAQAQNILIIDPLMSLRARRAQVLFYDHTHPSRIGHQIVANELHWALLDLIADTGHRPFLEK